MACPYSISIVGCPRSGTTLLTAVLNRHLDVVAMPETKLWSRRFNHSGRYRRQTLDRIAADSGLDEVQHVAATEPVVVWQWICKHFPKSINRPNVKYVINKVPEQSVAILHSELASSKNNKLILMVRDGYAVADSLTRVPWIHCDHGSAAAIWNHFMSHFTRFIDKTNNQPRHLMHVIRYEELIANPVATIADTLEFLELDSWSAADCLVPNAELDKYVFPPREATWKASSIETIDVNRLHCPREISTLNLQRIHAAAGPMLQRWGYARSLPKTSVSQQALLKIRNQMATVRTAMSLPPRMLIETITGF